MDELKKRYLEILQKYNSWGKSQLELENEAGDIFDIINIVGVESVEDFKKGFKLTTDTKLLVNTNQTLAPIDLNYSLELPLVELYFDSHNFVLFTTKCIYNCRKAQVKAIKYEDIVGVNQNWDINFIDENLKRNHFFDLKIKLSNNESTDILVERGIPFTALVYFVNTIITTNNKLK